MNISVNLPDGYKLVYGNEYMNEENKWSACNLEFHPDLITYYLRNLGFQGIFDVIKGIIGKPQEEKYYAIIRSYIETCKRFDNNIIEACNKLLEGNPYTLKELLKLKKD